LFSSRGTPYGHRHMHGFSSHTWKWVNKTNEVFWVKYHFKTDQGIRNLSNAEAVRIAGTDPDHSTRDLFDSIAKGFPPSWSMFVQIMPEAEAAKYKWNPFDVTKVWPHKDYPLIPVGKMVLNRNPENYFAEVEQSAFSPSHLIPGIEPSPDRMLQGRLFSYPDTQRHRLGVNFQQIPINCPYRVAGGVTNYQRDGAATFMNPGAGPNYEPNSLNGPVARPEAAITGFQASGTVGRYHPALVHANDDFEQPGTFFRDVLDEKEQDELVANLVGSISDATRMEVKVRACANLYRADRNLGLRVAKGVGAPQDEVETHVGNASAAEAKAKKEALKN